MSTMMVSAGPSPLEWLVKLWGALAKRQVAMQQLDSYYTGDHPLPFLTKAHESKMRDQFHDLLEDSRSNFMRLVVDVVEERLKVEGIRLSAARDELADQASWNIWQANAMDAESQVAFVEALTKGVSYMSVWSPAADGEYASVAVEDPLQTIVGYVPGSNYRQRAAALKVWRDDWTGDTRANVYMPDGIYKFKATTDDAELQAAVVSIPQDQFGGATYQTVGRSTGQARMAWVELADEFVANPVGIVPIVPLRNRPRLLVEGESELADVYRVQNQINGFLFLLALAGYYGSHRQRWVTGLALTTGPDGKPIAPFDTAVDRLWSTEKPDAKFGDFEQTDLTPLIKAIEQKVLHIAVTTRTPRHYLIEQGQSPSGDAIKSAEAGLIKKVERKQRTFGEGLEETLRLARLFQGESDVPVDSEIVWGDPEIRTEAEKTDAAVKKVQLGLIDRAQALEDLGYTQTQIARMLEAPAPEPTVPPGGGASGGQ